jgi:tyrosine-protein phosphatase SIW14
VRNIPKIARVLSTALLVLTATISSRAAAQEVRSAPAATTRSAIHIDNFGRINANYYRGSQPLGSDYRDLAALGIRTVVDLTAEGNPEEPAAVQRAGMRFYRIPMTTHETPSPETLSRFLSLVNDPANQPVYVHCQGGRHRTGVMTAAYRMTNDGWTPAQAFAEMKRYRFGADFLHPEFKEFVYAYRPDVVAPAGAVAAGVKTPE